MLKRLLIVFGFLLILGLIIFGVVFVLRSYGESEEFSSPPESVETEVTGQLPENPSQEAVTNSAPPVVKPAVSPEELERARAAVFAKDFAARLATYSNQNRSSNIEELLPETSGAARDYLLSLLRESRYQSEYVGVTSRALVSQWLDWNPAGESRIRVGLWRVETRNKKESGTMQDIELTIVKQQQRHQWMVNRIQWKDAR